MKTRLLFGDRDLELEDVPDPDPDLVVDLELERLFAAMASGDETILAVARRVLPFGAGSGAGGGRAPEAAAILRRQAVVADALANPGTVRELYSLASDALEAERRVWGGALRNPELVLHRSVEVLTLLLGAVTAVRDLLARDRASLRSAALLDLADRLARDVDDAFLDRARELLARLGERNLTVTASLGEGNRASAFILRRPVVLRSGLKDRIAIRRPKSLAVEVTLHDQNAMNAMAELRAEALAAAAGTVAEAASHLLAFCRRLRDEAAFLAGCANLGDALRPLGVDLVMPQVAAPTFPGQRAAGLVDPCLALAIGGGVTPNDIDTTAGPLTVVTGANGGGKSTVLRAIGVAQLLLNAGLPVAARAFTAAATPAVLSHFPRGEAPDAEEGRLEAELRRLAALVDRVGPDDLVLLNEPLATVNERDASVLAGGVTRGLVAGGARVWLVTHHHELAAGLHASPPVETCFLRAARGEGGERPYLVEPAPPLVTSYGEDLWTAEIEATWRQAPDAPEPDASTIE